MHDLISRQAAIGIVEFECGEWRGLASTIVKAIEQLPSAQPDIIRCKDCRHNHDCNIQYHAQAGEEFYCGAAERRIDGKNQN